MLNHSRYFAARFNSAFLHHLLVSLEPLHSPALLRHMETNKHPTKVNIPSPKKSWNRPSCTIINNTSYRTSGNTFKLWKWPFPEMFTSNLWEKKNLQTFTPNLWKVTVMKHSFQSMSTITIMKHSLQSMSTTVQDDELKLWRRFSDSTCSKVFNWGWWCEPAVSAKFTKGDPGAELNAGVFTGAWGAGDDRGDSTAGVSGIEELAVGGSDDDGIEAGDRPPGGSRFTLILQFRKPHRFVRLFQLFCWWNTEVNNVSATPFRLSLHVIRRSKP